MFPLFMVEMFSVSNCLGACSAPRRRLLFTLTVPGPVLDGRMDYEKVLERIGRRETVVIRSSLGRVLDRLSPESPDLDYKLMRVGLGYYCLLDALVLLEHALYELSMGAYKSMPDSRTPGELAVFLQAVYRKALRSEETARFIKRFFRFHAGRLYAVLERNVSPLLSEASMNVQELLERAETDPALKRALGKAGKTLDKYVEELEKLHDTLESVIRLLARAWMRSEPESLLEALLRLDRIVVKLSNLKYTADTVACEASRRDERTGSRRRQPV